MKNHPNVSREITFEASRKTLRLKELAPGQRVAVTLGEGQDCTDQARLTLELISPASDSEPAKFRVVSADLDAKVLEENVAAGMRQPELMGGEFWVRFACTYRRGYMPPITLAQKDVISQDRHLFGWIPNPSPEQPEQGFEYHAEVLNLKLL